jgi:uncharacterized ferritin-like protein (DUF455 family)
MTNIYIEEIQHVTVGIKWFKYLCEKKLNLDYENTLEKFYGLVKERFNGSLKPPFNEDARNKAGMGKEWYIPLSKDKVNEDKIVKEKVE